MRPTSPRPSALRMRWAGKEKKKKKMMMCHIHQKHRPPPISPAGVRGDASALMCVETEKRCLLQHKIYITSSLLEIYKKNVERFSRPLGLQHTWPSPGRHLGNGQHQFCLAVYTGGSSSRRRTLVH